MDKKEFLSQAFWLNELIDSDLNELRELQLKKASLSRSLFTANRDTTKGEAGFTKVVDKIVDLERKISNEITEYVCVKEKIREAINSLSEDNERVVMKMRYVNLMRWEEIADKMGYTERNVHNIHEQALKNIKLPK